MAIVFQPIQHRYRDWPRHALICSACWKSADLRMLQGGGPQDPSLLRTVDGKTGHAAARAEADLRIALVEGGFELHYQPRVDLRSMP